MRRPKSGLFEQLETARSTAVITFYGRETFGLEGETRIGPPLVAGLALHEGVPVMVPLGTEYVSVRLMGGASAKSPT